MAFKFRLRDQHNMTKYLLPIHTGRDCDEGKSDFDNENGGIGIPTLYYIIKLNVRIRL